MNIRSAADGIAHRTHLDEAALDRAMHSEGPDENICAVKIAIAQAALARPPAESARLLRDLTSIE